MYVLLEGHDIKKDLEELLNICFEPEKIIYLNDFKEYPRKGILFRNKIYLDKNKEVLKSEIYLDGILVKDYFGVVDDVEVHIDSQNKKRNVLIKKSILNLGNKLDLKWGILTGIRPIKIVHNLLDQNLSNSEIMRVLKDEYLVKRERASLAIKIALKQRKYIIENKDKFSIYISIPFCPTKCNYCSFPSFEIGRHKDYVSDYVSTLLYELEETFKELDLDKLNTIYIGGGTPTSLPIKEFKRILDFLDNNISNLEEIEFTVEAGRPDTLNYNYLQLLKDYKVNRISINPQTMNQKTLNKIGRNHSVEEIINIYRIAKELKFDSINMDLIIGLSDENLDDLEKTLKEIEKLNPDNLTIHTLTLKTGSKLENNIEKLEGNINTNKLDELIFKYISNMELEPYYLYRQKRSLNNLENIGYAKSGKECIYNISMMEERETILAFGLGGVSKIYLNGRIERVPNFKGINDYEKRIKELIDRKVKYFKG